MSLVSGSATSNLRGSLQLSSMVASTVFKRTSCCPRSIPCRLHSSASSISIVRESANVASKYMADSFYENMRSANDSTSYLINDLETLKHWGTLSNLVPIVWNSVISHQGTSPADVRHVPVQEDPTRSAAKEQSQWVFASFDVEPTSSAAKPSLSIDARQRAKFKD